MNQGDAFFIGFCAKKTKKVSGCPNSESVNDVCSVSDCIYPRADDWASPLNLNRAGLHNDERSAMRTIQAGQKADFDLFAYRIVPTEFARNSPSRERPVLAMFVGDGEEISPEPDLKLFEFLGYDPVSSQFAEQGTIYFECSPLSCNDCAGEHPVNSHCLISDRESAMQVAQSFADTDPEPGPYFVVEVWRKRSV